MVKRCTTEEFVRKAREVHGDKYDYSCTVYRTVHGDIEYICPIHGKIKQQANSHLRGHGCPYCSFGGIKGAPGIEIGDKKYDIINKDKERIKIKNPNEAINLLSKRGWRLVSVVTSGDKNVNRRFFMKKEITDDKEIEFGLQENKKRRY